MSTNNAAAQTGHYATVNGLKMYYEIHGSGSPLVLIHGGGSTITTSFGEILPYFTKHHKVIAVELQAHGHTPDRGVPLSFEQDADDVAALLQQLHTDSADILGFSNGANTTLQIGIRHPKVVRRLVVISAFYKREGMQPWFWDMMKHASLNNMPKGLQEAYLDITHDTARLQVMHDRDVERMVNFKDWKDSDLQAIQAPTFIMGSAADVMTPEHLVAMYRLLPHGKLTILPGVHGEFLGESITKKPGSDMPQIVAGIIEDFLQD